MERPRSNLEEACRALDLPRGRRRALLLAAIALALLISGWLLQERAGRLRAGDYDYSDLCRAVQDGKVRALSIRGKIAEGEFVTAERVRGRLEHSFRTVIAPADPVFWQTLHESGVRITLEPDVLAPFVRVTLALTPLALFVGIALWATRLNVLGARPKRTDDTGAASVVDR